MQGLGKGQFTANAAGTVTPTLAVQILVNGDQNNPISITPVISIPPLTIN